MANWESIVDLLKAPASAAVQELIKTPGFEDAIANTVRSAPNDVRRRLVRTEAQALPSDQRKQLADEIAGIAGPDPATANRLWVIVVGAFAFVLCGAFLVLAIGTFVAASGSVKPELVLAVFTSVVGFLAGLFSPSPVNGARKPNSAAAQVDGAAKVNTN